MINEFLFGMPHKLTTQKVMFVTSKPGFEAVNTFLCMYRYQRGSRSLVYNLANPFSQDQVEAYCIWHHSLFYKLRALYIIGLDLSEELLLHFLNFLSE